MSAENAALKPDPKLKKSKYESEENAMNKYDVTLTAHYEKTVSVYADTPEQAKEKIETVLFDTDIIQFSDEDFIG